MKQIRFDNNRTSSGHNSRILATRQMLHRVVAILVLVVVCAGAKATDYVITYTNGGTTYYVGMNGTSLQAKTTLDAACVWTCVGRNNTTENELQTSQSNTNRRRLRNKNNGNYYLNGAVSRSGNLFTGYTYTWNIGVSNNGSQYWYLDGDKLYHYDNAYSQGNGYLHNSSTTVTISTSSDNAFIAYTVTTEEYVVAEQDPFLTGGGDITVIGQSSPCIITQEARHATGINYKFNGADHKIPDTPEETFTNQWTLTGVSSDYATINSSTGAITYKASPDEDITASVKVKVTGNKGTTLESNTISVTFKAFPKFYYTATAKAATDGVESTDGGTVTGSTSNFVHGQQYNSTSASKEVTFTATPKTGYQFVGWGTSASATTYESTEATYTFTISLTTDNNTEATAASKTLYAIFKPLPKFYYTIAYAISTEYADGTSLTGDGGTVTVSTTDVQIAYGATSDATSATVASSDVTLKATANDGFSFKDWKQGSTVASTNAEYKAGGFTVSSKDQSKPTKVTFTATFGEYPIFYAKLDLKTYECLAETQEYSTENKGSDIYLEETLTDGLLAVHATEPNLTSLKHILKLTARTGEGFGFRGWSTTKVSAADIVAGPYMSSAAAYEKEITLTHTTKDAAQAADAVPIYAYFQEFPIFYFKPTVEVIPMTSASEANPGTATVEPDGILESHSNTLTATEATATATYSATAKAGYKFGGWYTKNADDTYTEVSTYNPYMARLKSTSTDKANPTETKLYAQFLTSMLTITAEDIVLDTESDGWLNITVTPADAWKSYIITSETPSLVYVDNFGHCRTNLTPGTTTIHIQGVMTDGSKPDELKTSVTARVRVKCKMPTISFAPSADGTKAVVTLTRSADDPVDGSRTTTLYWTTDDPSSTTTTPTWTKYNGTSFEIDPESVTTVYAKSVMLKSDGTTIDTDYTESSIAQNTYQKPLVEKPVVTVDNTGVTFSSNTTGTVTYYYTVNDAAGGTDPTTTSYTGTWTTGNAAISSIASEKYIRVIATKPGYLDSEVTEKQHVFASGVNGTTVILNDYEDHTWAYYQPADKLPEGYPTGYLNSPDPRNVKITYYGNGKLANLTTSVTGVKVGIDANANTFIYYKTIENNNGYKYTTIPNPFSVRPKIGNNYYGFVSWRVKSVSGGTITGQAVGSTINAETEITFVPTSSYTPNCTSMEVELEAVWDEAEVSTNGTFSKNYNSVERNFYVISSSSNDNISALSTPCTYTSLYPNGTTNGTTTATNVTVYKYGGFTAKADSKIEYIILRNNNNSTISGEGYNLVIGRGVSGYDNGVCANIVRGISANSTKSFSFRIESGRYNNLYFMGSVGVTTGHMTAIMGCDYDRANNKDNSKLKINTDILMSNGGVAGTNTTIGTERIHCTVKSGNYDLGSYGQNVQFYMSSPGSNDYAKRTLVIEGGNFSDVSGGMENNTNGDVLTFDLRVKGGTINGATYGAAQNAAGSGNRRFIITGGVFKGWIAGGANGTNTTGGKLKGKTAIYFGGTAECNSNGSTTTIGPGQATGGNIFGAGSGNSGAGTNATVGEVDQSIVVIADKSSVEHSVYGGGNYGYVAGTGNANKSDIFILGGTVNEKVFGGSNMQKGNIANITMTGGLVKGGVHGGSNTRGTLSGSVTMQINGGQVGTTTKSANIHGGGYGKDTGVTENVDLTIGMRNATTGVVSGDAVIYGDVYGGSALGYVNGTNVSTSKHTNVTLNSGTIYGSLYGGGLGNETTEANVYGPVAVKVYGGSVKKTDETGENGSGSVYGGNNQNGKPQSTVTVDIYQTDEHNNGPDNEPGTDDDEYAIFSVFGGGNQAAYTYSGKDSNNEYFPQVTVYGCDNSIGYVYGGGNHAAVEYTNVKINGGNVIGRVFGGGYGADVNHDISLKIYGGHILKVFGGNNADGEVKGNIDIDVSQTNYTSSSCPIVMDYLYGGGNNADSKTASMDIRYADWIGTVFGGACSANMTGSVDLNIVAGKIGTVFGGNDQAGSIEGDNINVTVNWWDGDDHGDGVNYERDNNSLGSVYGGGNVAAYTGHTKVKVLNADLTGSVYGGGKKADINGSTVVLIGDWKNDHMVNIDGDVYGGGDQAAVTNMTKVTICDCSTMIGGDVYGGGNAAEVGTSGGNAASTNVTVWGGTMDRVFGGGHGYPTADPVIGADIYGSTNVFFYGGTANGVFGGSNSVGNITGKSTVLLDQQLSPNDVDGDGVKATEACELNLQEAYGAGNEAYMSGEPALTIGCVDELGEIYGGARNADITRDIKLNIESGKFRRVFGGNNEGGCVKGSITVNIEEKGCHPIVINELYGCGNQAAYSVFGYKDDSKPKTKAEATDGTALYDDPTVNVISCTKIGSIFGGGYGEGALVIGTPTVHIDMVEGLWSNRVTNQWNNKLGTIGAVFGGGNAAKVDGDTQVLIGTDGKGVNISGNVYGGGNAADVTGKTNVQIGPEPAE